MNIKDNYDGALQRPLGTGMGALTTTAEVIRGIDLSGKTAVVTGGYAGIGLETVKAFVGAGARVFVPARDIAKASANLKGLDGVTVWPMDLMDGDSIDAFAERFLVSCDALDILVNNAGIMWVPLVRDRLGYESQLSTNHLGHFRLTARLWPALVKAGSAHPAGFGSAVAAGSDSAGFGSVNGARVVNVSSYGHQIAPFDFDDPNFLHRSYETLQGYGQSKTANNLFTVELDHRGKDLGVRAFSLHPGSVYGTDLGRVAPMSLFQQMGTHDAEGRIFPEVEAKLKTLSQGAATSVWCAVSPLLSGLGGVYCEDCNIAEIDNGQIEHIYSEPASLRGVRPYSVDAENARRLWRLTEALTGVVFPI